MAAWTSRWLVFCVLCQLWLQNLVEAVLTCPGSSALFADQQWAYCMVLNSDLIFHYGPENATHVRLGLQATNHDGWSAVALAGNGGMKGSSPIVVRKVSDTWVAEDRYTEIYGLPELDESQDVQLLFADQSFGTTSWGVVLPRVTCDRKDYPIEDFTQWLLWAKSSSSSHDFAYHGSNKGQFSANLISGPPSVPNTDGYDNVNITMPNVDVVLGSGGTDPTNPYICGFFDVESTGYDSASKYHVAKFAPILDATTGPYVHHMLLYQCSSDAPIDNPSITHGAVVEECESMPRGCTSLVWAWARGSTDIVLPEDVGFPVGEGSRYLVLQMHYYNPTLVTGLKDRSGVKLTVAPQLRAQDAGVLQINGGTSPGQGRPGVPAGEPNYVMPPMVVPSQCTSTWSDTINILGVVHHAHLIGKSQLLAVSRGGNYVGPLRREYRYDFNHQSFAEGPVKQIQPGDEITYMCWYDSTSRSQYTDLGDLTQNEMCISFVTYYPRQQMTNAMARDGGVACWNPFVKQDTMPAVPLADLSTEMVDIYSPLLHGANCPAPAGATDTSTTTRAEGATSAGSSFLGCSAVFGHLVLLAAWLSAWLQH